LHANLGDHRDVRWSGSMTRSSSGISAGPARHRPDVTGIGARLRASRRHRYRISSFAGRDMHPIMHERTSADDQTAAQIDPLCASFERPHDISAAVHIGGSVVHLVVNSAHVARP
jgi:hypothetical protein